MRYEWQAQQWQQIWQARLAQRLPHAILLSGIEGIGKADFASHLAQALLCPKVSNEGDACCECHACRLVMTDAHPNVKRLTPEKQGHAIKVDQVREIGEFVQQSSLQGEYRFAIINPAHSMNINAANALLKTLEEPADGAVIILISDRSGHLPATIRSRCHKIAFPRPDQKLALAWLSQQKLGSDMTPEQRLRLFNGAPLLAVAMQDDDFHALRLDLYRALTDLAARNANPLKLAAKWQKANPVQWLDLFFNWVSDLVRLQLGVGQQFLVNQDFVNELNATAKTAPLNNNLRTANALVQARRQLGSGINFNKQLLIESTLIKWLESSPCS
jgi:DNA polymerase-3 subunit delta'